MPGRRAVQGPDLAIGMSRMNRMRVGVSFNELLFSARLWTYQLSSYAILNLLDDPAWLALMFC